MTEYIPVRGTNSGLMRRHLAQIVERQYKIDGHLVTGKVAVTLCNRALVNYLDVTNTSYTATDGSLWMHDCPICKAAQP